MLTSPIRLLSLFAATILAGIVATMLAPRLASAQAAVAVASPAAAPEAGVATARGLLPMRLPVALRDLQRGDTLRADDFALVDTSIVWRWQAPPADTATAIVGWVARRAIARGELLRAPAIGAPTVIAGGATVQAIWQDGPVRLVLTGTAVNSAALGGPVGVRIDRSRRLDGIAVAPNTVRLR